MPDLIATRKAAPWHRRLYLPAYAVAEAARYAGVAPQTVSAWHHRSISSTGPALPERARGKPLSYLELVEVAVVAVFRQFDVPLKSLQETRTYMAKTFRSEYPFAEYRFKTDGYHLLLDLQQVVPGLPTDDLIVTDRSGQLGWNALMADKLLEFDYDMTYELALRWFVAGRGSKVVIDPRVSYGAPTVRGIPTFALKGRWLAGETIGDIREDFAADEDDIVDALVFEGVERGSILR